VRTPSIARVIIIIALMVEAVRTSETLVYSNEIAQRCISEGSHLYCQDDMGWACTTRGGDEKLLQYFI
jgi:hypothetical protein